MFYYSALTFPHLFKYVAAHLIGFSYILTCLYLTCQGGCISYVLSHIDIWQSMIYTRQ